MDINITVHELHIHHGASDQQLAAINHRLDAIMTTQAELAASLANVKDEVKHIGDETRTLITKVQDLTDALAAAGNTTPEVDAAVAALKDQVKVVDDLVPDAP